MAKRRGNHEGSIHQLPSGTFRAQVTLRSHRLSFTAKTRRECQEWIRQTRDQIDDGLTYASTKLKLAKYLSDWLTIEKAVMRESTWVHYQQLIRMYIAPNIGVITLKDLRTEHIQGLYNHLMNQKVGTPTIRKIHKLLRSSLGAALETGMITRNPVSYARPPRESISEMKILDEDQVSQFLIAIHGHKWEALFYLAITTGMRRNELLGLKWEDLDWIKKTVRIDRQLSRYPNSGAMFQPLKTKSSRRTIALGDKTIQVLRDHYERQHMQRLAVGEKWIEHNLIFCNSGGGPICPSHMIKVFQELLKVFGLPKIRFHDLRHTAASLMLNNNISPVAVAQRLGHSKTSTTLDVYGHLIESYQREAAVLIDELITPIKLHTNCTQSHQPDQNATVNDEITVFIAKNIINGV